MSLFDPPKQVLNPFIWDSSRQLHEDLREEILSRIYYTFGKDRIKEVISVGSLTGYFWNETSDLDIMVKVVDLPEGWEKTRWTQHTINGKKIPGSMHEISYFLLPYNPEAKPPNYAFADTGIYDVVNNVWLAFSEREKTMNLSRDHYDTRAGAEVANSLFIKNLQSGSPHGFSAALNIVKQIDTDRKTAYTIGAGTPRFSKGNMKFKYFEDVSEYGQEFKEMLETLSNAPKLIKHKHVSRQ
jgi:hypothetical protein